MLDLLIMIAAVVVILRLLRILGRNDLEGFSPGVAQTNAPHETSLQPDIEIVSAAEAALPGAVRNVLDEIRKFEPTFNADYFYVGAKKAFMMIVKGFAEKKLESLKSLLGTDLFQQMSSSVNERIAKQQELSKTILGINNIEIVEASLDGSVATLSVQIISDQITFLSDNTGNIVEGNSSTIYLNTEIWTFSRDLSKQKIWLLVATKTV